MDFVQLRFKELRKELKMTQPEIAEILGYKVAMWQKLEAGRTPDPRASTIVHICKTLDVSSDWLLGLTDTVPKAVKNSDNPPCAGGDM